MLKGQKGFAHLGLITLLAIVVATVGFAGYRVINKQQSWPLSITNGSGSAESKAARAGKLLSNGKCQGTDKVKLTHLPMREQDFSILIPYGLVVGGHVTPIDHQYFSPAAYNSPRDAYPVYAMADATITDIQPRTNERGIEYRFVFTVSCTSFYYYDLVTSLAGKVKQAYDKHQFNLPIKAGEQVGYIGGQTLDFAVWDTEKPLTGFINPASYDGEAWKIYTADPYPFYTPALRALLTERNPRIVKPIAGKIDYDIDGKLVGNWFVVGSGGYGGTGPRDGYWKTHLSIAPDLYDPTHFIISIGDFGGEAKQFVDANNSPNPATVGISSSLVKYDLTGWSYLASSGAYWDRMSAVKGLKLKSNGQIEGCLLAQLTGTRTLKAEAFPNKNCTTLNGFGASSKIYER